MRPMPAVLALFLATFPVLAQPCEPRWSDEFPRSDTSGYIKTFTVFDDGSGPALIAGGPFSAGGGARSRGVAKWTGVDWQPFGAGLDWGGALARGVTALAAFDEGSGSTLYAGGSFYMGPSGAGVPLARFARWSGSQWDALAATPLSEIRSLAIYDDGTGPNLYAGVARELGTTTGPGVFRWNGLQWEAVGPSFSTLAGPTGAPARVDSIQVFDDGTGSALYAAGSFSKIGNATIRSLARWNGTQWSQVGAGLPEDTSNHRLLSSARLGGVPHLFLAGAFVIGSASQARNLAEWNGAEWIPFGAPAGPPASVLSISPYSTPSESGLLLGLKYAPFLVLWKETGFSTLGAGVNEEVDAAAQIPDSPSILAAGEFSRAGEADVQCVAKWDGHDWSALRTGGVLGDWAYRLRVLDEGTGPALYLCGQFIRIANTQARGLAKWDGTTWAGYTDPLLYPWDVAVFDAGMGPALTSTTYANPSGLGVFGTAQLINQQWRPLGTAGQQEPRLLQRIDDGPDAGLYVCYRYGGIAKWDGSGFALLPELNTCSPDQSAVWALSTFGAESSLYAGGGFVGAGANLVNRIARRESPLWAPVGGGIGAPCQPGISQERVIAMIAYDDGSGPSLFVGGRFSTAGGTTVRNIARWDGAAWRPVGEGIAGPNPRYDDQVTCFAIHDDGHGPSLYVGGYFAIAGDVPASNLAKWDGKQWSAVAGGLNHRVDSLVSFDDGRDRSLWAAGIFSGAGGVNSRRIARLLSCAPLACYPNCDLSTSTAGAPTLSIGDYICFLSRFAALDPYANCDASAAAPTLNVADFICFMNKFAAGCP